MNEMSGSGNRNGSGNGKDELVHFNEQGSGSGNEITPEFMSALREAYEYCLTAPEDLQDDVTAYLQKFVVYDCSGDDKIKIYKMKKQIREFLEWNFPTKIVESEKFFKEIYKTGSCISRSKFEPAIRTVSKKNNMVMREQCFVDGIPVEGVSDVSYHPNGRISIERNFNTIGELHDRPDGQPAEIHFNVDQTPKYSCRYDNGRKSNLFGSTEIFYKYDDGDDIENVRYFIDGIEFNSEEEYDAACEEYLKTVQNDEGYESDEYQSDEE